MMMNPNPGGGEPFARFVPSGRVAFPGIWCGEWGPHGWERLRDPRRGVGLRHVC
jgi:hypothetical protein